MDVWHTLFTFWYNMHGDTYFDTGTSARMENVIMAWIFYFIFLNYFIFGFLKVSLAQLEDGYLSAKICLECDWLRKDIINDPGAISELDTLR